MRTRDTGYDKYNISDPKKLLKDFRAHGRNRAENVLMLSICLNVCPSVGDWIYISIEI